MSTQPVTEALAEAAGTQLRGLHAKVFVADAGRYPRVFTGSANATTAAYGGNIEFVAEMVGKKASAGIDATLYGTNREVSLFSLLEPYQPANEAPVAQSVQEQLAQQLDLARRALASQPSTLTIGPTDTEDQYELTLVTGAVPDGVTAQACPITLPRGTRRQPLTANTIWSPVSFRAITPFIAIQLEASQDGIRESAEFVIQAELVHEPDNRLERLLTLELESPRSVLRYLVFLLAAGETDIRRLLDAWTTRDGATNGESGTAIPELPLLETMVRALAHEPARLDAVAHLVRDLSSTPDGQRVLPARFNEIWDPINAARGKSA